MELQYYIKIEASIGTRWLKECDLSNEKTPFVITTGKVEKALQWPYNDHGFEKANALIERLQKIGITCCICLR